MTQSTFDEIVYEVKKVNQRLDMIEKTLASLMTMLAQEEELSEEEWKELDTIEAEMKSGQSITLEEL